MRTFNDDDLLEEKNIKDDAERPLVMPRNLVVVLKVLMAGRHLHRAEVRLLKDQPSRPAVRMSNDG